MDMYGVIVFFIHIRFICVSCIENYKGLEPPASDFSRYSVVQPTVQHFRTKRNIHTTRQENGIHHSKVTVKLPLYGEEYILDLQLNQDLITENHVLRYQENGKTVLHKPKKEEIDLCHYGGTVRDKPNSWVAVSTCDGIQGIVFDGKRMKYIEPAQSGDINSKHYIYDHRDLSASYKCGNDVTNHSYRGLHLNQKYFADNLNNTRLGRFKRHTDEVTKLQSPYNANEKSRYVEFVLVADHREYMKNNYNVQSVYRNMKKIANIINSLFTQLNIFIALVGVVVWTQGDEIVLEPNSTRSLYNFLKYTEDVLPNIVSFDNAHLLTRQKFLDGIVGKAQTKSMCTSDMSGGVSTNHSPVSGVVAATIAHEMGHNFGMDHDLWDDCECPDNKCIMSPTSTDVVPVHWSSCSLSSLVLSFDRGFDSCLRNKPRSLFESPMCGNGFVEPGEQCDCGAGGGACSACCDPATCMLRRNATCGAGACCELRTCRPKAAGTLCRGAERECDLPEYCTGHSEFCPDDVYKMDTTPCRTDGQSAYCVKGTCRSHTDQCRLLWGATGRSHEFSCYQFNRNGKKSGHCGYDRYRNTYVKCSEADLLCGVVKCTHLTTQPQITYKTIYTQQITMGDKVTECTSVHVNMITQEGDLDLGMVPDGAKCGPEKMCLKQRCVSVADVRQRITKLESSVCPSNCSGHGVCNSAGHCHCEPGFAPPLCSLPGPGGSYDSKPATDPDNAYHVMVAIYVLFLGIVPLILLVLCLVYRYYPKGLQSCYGTLRKSVRYFQFESLHISNTRSCANEYTVQTCRPDTIKEIKIEHTFEDINKSEVQCDNAIYAQFQPIYANISIDNLQKNKNEMQLPNQKNDKIPNWNAGEIISKKDIGPTKKRINRHEIKIVRDNNTIDMIKDTDTTNKDIKVSKSTNDVAKYKEESEKGLNYNHTKSGTGIDKNSQLPHKPKQKEVKPNWKINNSNHTDDQKNNSIARHMLDNKDANTNVSKDFEKRLIAKKHNNDIRTSKKINAGDIKIIKHQLNKADGEQNKNIVTSSNTSKRGVNQTPIDIGTRVNVKKLVSNMNATAMGQNRTDII